MNRSLMYTLTRLALVAGFGIATACGDIGSTDGTAGQSGMPGNKSPAELHGDNRGLIWKDAAGKTLGTYLIVAELAVGVSAPTLYALLDSQGILWRVDPIQGTIRAFNTAVRSYVTTDCTGDAYVRSTTLLPRWAVEFPGKGYRTIKDDVTPQKTPMLRSFEEFSANQYRCVEGYISIGIPATYLPTDFIPVQDPPSGTAPFHIESQP